MMVTVETLSCALCGWPAEESLTFEGKPICITCWDRERKRVRAERRKSARASYKKVLRATQYGVYAEMYGRSYFQGGTRIGRLYQPGHFTEKMYHREWRFEGEAYDWKGHIEYFRTRREATWWLKRKGWWRMPEKFANDDAEAQP